MKKAVLYARVSSDLQQRERTIESQVEELKKQIANAGDVLVKEYIDDGYSGARLDRPAMDQLRNDLKTNIFDTIYILNTDRIARDVTYQNIIIGEMLRYKKQIIINGKDYVHNPENKFTLTVLGAVSELERAKLIERVMRGRQYRLSQGYLLGHGWQTYGYTYSKKSITSFPSYTINENEAKIVRYIFETYAKGQIGARTIVRQLEEMGVLRTKGRNLLGQTQVRFILKNVMYTGIRYFNMMTDQDSPKTYRNKHGKQVLRDRSEWVGVKIPAIISKELFDKVQKRLEYNRTCYRNALRTQLLSNLVWCGKCNSRCFSYRRYYQVKRKDGVRLYQRAVYRCRVKGKGHNPEIDTRVLESCVIDMIKETLFNPRKLYEHLSLSNKKIDKTKIAKQIDNIDEKIHSINKQKERIIDLYASGHLEREEYIRRTLKYEAEIEELENKQSEAIKYLPLFQKPETLKSSIAVYSKKVKNKFEKCAYFQAKRQFLLDNIVKVAYHRNGKTSDKVRLYGSVPIQLKDQSEIILVDFKIERIVNRDEILEKVREIDLTNDTWGGIPIQSMEYGKLVMTKSPEIQSI